MRWPAQRYRKAAEDGGGKARIPERRLAVGDEIDNNTGTRGDRQPEKKSSLGDLDFDRVLKAAPRRRGEPGEAQAEARVGHALRNRRPTLSLIGAPSLRMHDRPGFGSGQETEVGAGLSFHLFRVKPRAVAIGSRRVAASDTGRK